MIGHLAVNVADLAAAKAYYDELMPLLGFVPYLSEADQFAYCPADRKPGTYFFVYPASAPGDYSRERAGLQHLGFMVPTRSAVRAVHAWVVELGGEVLHEPQEWPQYPPPYYATFWLDPHGFMLEAICHKDVD